MKVKKNLPVFSLICMLLLFVFFPQPVHAMTSTDNLSISIDDGAETVIAGTEQTYTITVNNNDDHLVTCIPIGILLPTKAASQASWEISTSSGGVVLTPDSNSNSSGTVSPTDSGTAPTILAVDMESGSSLTITVTPKVLSYTSGSFDMKAWLLPDISWKSASDSDQIEQQVDLSVSVDTYVANTTSVAQGGTVCYLITPKNNGPSDVLGATLTCLLPNGTTSSWGPENPYNSGAAYANPMSGTGELKTTLNLPAGTSYPFWFTVKTGSDTAGHVIATATITAPDTVPADPTPDDNIDSCSVAVVPDADLVVDVSFGDQTGNPAGVVTYDVEVWNNGPAPTTNVTLSVPVPSGATFGSATAAQGTAYDKDTGIWNVGSLNNSESKILEFKVTPDYSSEQTVTATIKTSDIADSNTDNNADSLTITDRTDLALTAFIDNPNAAVGDTVTLTLAAINKGSIKATNVFVKAVLPAGLTYVSDDSEGHYSASEGIWDTGNLKIDTTKTITIKAMVSSSADQTVTATVNASQPDPDLTNNTASVTVSSKVTDTTPPTIVLLGDNPMTISFGGVYAEPGATVTDNCDDGLTAVTSGVVDTGKAGTYPVTYTATDRSGNTSTAARTVIVKENHAPIAVNDSYSTNRGTPLNIAVPGLLGNDTDIDGNHLTVVKAGKPIFGKLTVNADGSFNYTPDKYFVGTDSFKYYISDGTANSNTATVTIKVVRPVNHAPVANNDKYSTTKNTPLKIAAPGVLGNDTDADGNSLNAILAGVPMHGRLMLNADGSIIYKPDMNYIGADNFWYFVSDGSTWSNFAKVTITVVKP